MDIIYNSDVLDKEQLSKIKNLAEKFFVDFIRKLRLNLTDDLDLVIVKKEKFYDLLKTKFDDVSAFTEGNKIYFLDEKLKNINNELINVLKHEIVHVVLNKVNINQKEWVSEGSAIYFSNQLLKMKEDRANLYLEDYYSIEELENNFNYNKKAYFLSGIYIKYIFEKHRELFNDLIRNKISIYDIEKESISFFVLDN